MERYHLCNPPQKSYKNEYMANKDQIYQSRYPLHQRSKHPLLTCHTRHEPKSVYKTSEQLSAFDLVHDQTRSLYSPYNLRNADFKREYWNLWKDKLFVSSLPRFIKMTIRRTCSCVSNAFSDRHNICRLFWNIATEILEVDHGKVKNAQFS